MIDLKKKIDLSLLIEAFLLLQSSSPVKFKRILEDLEVYYIGQLVPLSRTVRQTPTFPISTWNLYQRILDDKPRVTNSVESWHQTLTPDLKTNIDIESLVEIFRKEQAQTETWLAKLSTGREHKKKKRKCRV